MHSGRGLVSRPNLYLTDGGWEAEYGFKQRAGPETEINSSHLTLLL